MCYNFTMSAKGYFSNLQNRYSANFIALISFLSLMLPLSIDISYYVSRYINCGEDFTNPSFFSGQYILSTALLGSIVLFVIFPLSLLFFILLKTKRKIPTILLGVSFLFLCIVFFIIFINHYDLVNEPNAWINLLVFYFRFHKFLLPIFIAIPILCFIDFKKNILVANYNFVNNELYIVLIYIFYFYCWLQYIPFVLGLLVYFYLGLH